MFSKFPFFTLFILLFFTSCNTVTQQETYNRSSVTALSSIQPSYFVKPDGSDRNNGFSSSSAFKNLQYAIDMAKRTSIKTIIVIGTLELINQTMRYNDKVLFGISDNGLNDSKEILIKGLDNANENEKAILSGIYSNNSIVFMSYGNCYVKFENIEITEGRGIAITSPSERESPGIVTIGQGTAIYNNQIGAFVSNGCKLIIDGGIIHGNKNTERDSSGTGITVWEGGELILTSGKIINNESYNGGAIVVNEGGVFVMNGGFISNNYAKQLGGAIAISPRGKFLMTGGEISNNYAEIEGGAIIVSGEFIMENGRIVNNHTKESNGTNIDFSRFQDTDSWLHIYGGGGVSIRNGVFRMVNGEISNNISYGFGGGVLINLAGTFIMEDGILSGNTAILGGGVFQNYGNFAKLRGIIYGQDASDILRNNAVSNLSEKSGQAIFIWRYKPSLTIWEMNDTIIQAINSINGNNVWEDYFR